MVVPFGLWASFSTKYAKMCYNVHTKARYFSIFHTKSMIIKCSENTDHIYRVRKITQCVTYLTR